VKAAPSANPEEAEWLLESQELLLSDAEDGLMELLDELVRGSPYAVVVEAGEVRILPRAEAIEIFRAWLKEPK